MTALSGEQRLYLLQSSPHCGFHWGFYTGTASLGRQVFVARTGSERIAAVFFDGQGNLVEVCRELLPEFANPPEDRYWDVNEADFHRYLSDKCQFIPGSIRVKRFEIPEDEIRIEDLPHLYRLILEKPDRFGWDEPTRQKWFSEINEWVAAKSFVLECRNEISHLCIDNQGRLIIYEDDGNQGA